MNAASLPTEITGAIQALEEKLLDEEVVPLIQDRFELDQLLDQLRHGMELLAEDKQEEENRTEKDAAAQQAAREKLRLRQTVDELSGKMNGMSREQRFLKEALRRQAEALRRLENNAGSERGRPRRFLMGFGLGMSMVPGIFFLFCFLLNLFQRGAKYTGISLPALLGGLGCIILGLLLFAGAGLFDRGQSVRRNRKDDRDEEL